MAQIGTISRFEVSGEILNEDVLALLAIRDAGVPGADMDKAEEGDFYAAWDLLRDQWQSIRSEVADFDTERLRRRWIIPLLELFGHKPEFLRSHPTLASGASVPITHRTDTIPIWLADFAEKPDDRPTEGKRRRSKHELFQEFLDMTEDDWGILCTGRTIRLLTDYHKTLTRNFVEADLESIFDELDIDAFRIVWRLFRASAFVPKAKGVRDIERIRDHASQQGTEIGKELRKQVVEAVVTLANGFLEADESGELRQAVESDSEGPMRLYQSVLRVVYRLLFLLYVENKPGWTPAQDPRWASGYSISRLRAMAEDPGSYRAEGEDLWEGLKVTFRIIREGCTLFNEPISPYGGELFDDERLWLLKDSPLANAPLLRALYLLTIFERREKKISTLHRVNFRNLQIDALGSVYESLLEERPILDAEGRFGFYHRAGKGNKRKETGSYYTPPELVAELIKTALLPVIEDRLMGKTTQAEQREAILGISVVDPACGSGAFLIQALDALAEALLKVQLGDEQPSELQLREARRDVAIHCIHGVDMNPMAVELCKFTIWLHVAHPKFPLSYLEPLIRSGNSLVGVPTKAQIEEAKRVLAEERQTLLQQGKANDAKKAVYVGWEGFDLEPSKLTKVPDEAFAPVGDDDKSYAKSVQERNKSERAGQLRLTEGQAENFTEGRLTVYRHMQEIKELDPEKIKEKERRFNAYLKSGAYRLPKRFADAWCAAFFWPLKNPLSASGEGDGSGVELPTHAEVAKLHPAKQRASEPTPVNAELVREIERRAEALQFFHWELEYPDVFEKGGFDVVLGNPPWDQVQIDPKEFFAGIRGDIATVRTSLRDALIEKLREDNPALYERFGLAQHGSDGFKKFVHFSGLFPLTEHGRINVAPLFAELIFTMHRESGRAGFILPSGIATDSFKQKFFARLVDSESLASFMDFENRQKHFDIDSRFKFALMTLARGRAHHTALRYFLHSPSEIDDPTRKIDLTPADFRLINPNTRTAPVVRTFQDVDLLRFIYERVPILVNERTRANLWGIRYQLMFMMNSDLIHSTPAADDMPLFEGKMFHQFDHRWASFSGGGEIGARDEHLCDELDDPGEIDGVDDEAQTGLRLSSLHDKEDPYYLPAPRFWVNEAEVLLRVVALSREEKKNLCASGTDHLVRALRPRAPKWLLVLRDIARSTDERTSIFSVIPLVGCGNNAPVLYLAGSSTDVLGFVSIMNSLVCDWVIRLKVGGAHLSQSYLFQVPMVAPEAYRRIQNRVASLALELVYTSEHLRPLAQACGYAGDPFPFDEARRAVLRAELDALVARLYGLNRKQLRYILDPHGLSWAELEDINDPWEDPTCCGPHLLPAEPALDFPGETFRVLKDKEEKKFGEFRTRRLVLEAWGRLWKELGPVEPLPVRFGPNAPNTPDTVQESRASYRAVESAQMPLLDVPLSTGLFADPAPASPRPQPAPMRVPTPVSPNFANDEEAEEDDEEFTLVAPEPKPPTPLKDKQGDIIRVRVLSASGQEIVAAGTVVGSKKQGQAVEWAVLVDETNAVRKFLSPPATLKRLQGGD